MKINNYNFILIEKIYTNLEKACDTCLCFAEHVKRSSNVDYKASSCLYKQLESQIFPVLNEEKTFLLVRINSMEVEYFFRRIQITANSEYTSRYLAIDKIAKEGWSYNKIIVIPDRETNLYSFPNFILYQDYPLSLKELDNSSFMDIIK